MKYDFECRICSVKIEVTASIKTGPVPPTHCGILPRRIFTPTNFSISGYTSANGYDKSEDGWREKVTTGAP